jgi:hypothetical protein
VGARPSAARGKATTRRQAPRTTEAVQALGLPRRGQQVLVSAPPVVRTPDRGQARADTAQGSAGPGSGQAARLRAEGAARRAALGVCAAAAVASTRPTIPKTAAGATSSAGPGPTAQGHASPSPAIAKEAPAPAGNSAAARRAAAQDSSAAKRRDRSPSCSPCASRRPLRSPPAHPDAPRSA